MDKRTRTQVLIWLTSLCVLIVLMVAGIDIVSERLRSAAIGAVS